MPPGGGCKSFLGGCTPPRKSVPATYCKPFVSKVCDLIQGPIGGFVYKPTCEICISKHSNFAR
jgi:hypothetical protein